MGTTTSKLTGHIPSDARKLRVLINGAAAVTSAEARGAEDKIAVAESVLMSVDGAAPNLSINISSPDTSFDNLIKPVYNVKDSAYGAVGDGVTDDYAAIQAALDAADAAGGGVVFIPADSTYIIGTQLYIGSNTTVIGGGWSTILKMKDASDLAAVLSAQTQSNIQIRELQIDGNKANQTANLLGCLVLANCTDMNINNVLVHDAKGTTGGGNEGSGIIITGSTEYEARVTIADCIAYNIGGVGIGTYRAGMVTITNCQAYDNDSMGFSLSGGPTTNRQNTVSNCVAWDNGESGFNLEGQANTIISGCVSSGHNTTGLGGFRISRGRRIVIADCVSYQDEIGVVFLSTTEADQPTSILIDGVIVTNCDQQAILVDAYTSSTNQIQIVNCIINTTGAGYSGIDVTANVSQVTISNNFISFCGQHGIRALSTSLTTINGNTCQGNTSSGIRVSSSTGRVVVTGNSCYNNDNHGIAIEDVTEFRGATVSGNVCNNNSRGLTATYDGISIDTSVNCSVTGNVCTDTTGTPTQRYGIAETGTCDYNTYVSNVLHGNNTGALLESGANNKAAHNIGVATDDVDPDLSGAAGDGLVWDAGNTELDVGAGNGITVNADDITLALKTTSGLALDGTGLSVGEGDGVNVLTGTVEVDVTDLIGSGLIEEATNNIALNTPGTLTAATGNTAAGNHTHAVTTTSDGAGTVSTILAGDANGDISLRRLTVDDRIIHDNDADTYLEFTADQAAFTVGGTATITSTASAISMAGLVDIEETDAATNTQANVLTISHESTGTPAPAFGSAISFIAESASVSQRDQGRMTFRWITATDASRAAGGRLTAYYTTSEQVAVGWNANSGGIRIAFYGGTPVGQHGATGETTGFSAGTGTGVNDDSTFTGNTGSTAYTISDVVKALKNIGIMVS